MIRVVILGACVSLLLAYLTAPVAQWLRRRVRVGRRRRPLSRPLAILAVYAIGLVGVGTAWAILAPRSQRQAGQLAAALPIYSERALVRARSVSEALPRPAVPGVVSDLTFRVVTYASVEFEEHVRRTLDEIDEGLPHLQWLWLTPLVAFLLLQSFPAFRRSTLRFVPTEQGRWRVDEFVTHVNSVLAGYVRAQIVSGGFVAIATAALLAAQRVPYALSLGLAAGVLEFLPVVGPIAIALTVAMLTTGPQLMMALASLALVRVLQDLVVYPRVVGRRMHLHPLAVLIAVALGARFGGIVGVAMAVPLVGIAAVAWRHWRDHRDITRLVREHAARHAAILDSKA